jgi:hypothetical protein
MLSFNVYTHSELARLKQFIEDSKKPLYPDFQKYSRLKLLELKEDHGWRNKRSNIYWMCLETCYLKETK